MSAGERVAWVVLGVLLVQVPFYAWKARQRRKRGH